MPWFKGNLHTHSTRSNDGKATPQEACDWYRKRATISWLSPIMITSPMKRIGNRSDSLLVIRGR